jgi:hypothetical protein
MHNAADIATTADALPLVRNSGLRGHRSST